METLTKSSRINRFERSQSNGGAFIDTLGLPREVRNAKLRFPGRVFDLPDGTHEFGISWASNRNRDYPCFGVVIENYLPVSMLATDYEAAVKASPEEVQQRAWVGSENIHPNFEEILLTVVKNRPAFVSLKK